MVVKDTREVKEGKKR